MRIFSLMLAGLLLVLTSCSGPQVEVTFFTEGNCADCKPMIEAAVKDLSGVSTANWNFETSQTTIVYSANSLSEDELQQAIAEAGFSTQYFPANEEARAKLPACCRESIERKLKPATPLPEGH